MRQQCLLTTVTRKRYQPKLNACVASLSSTRPLLLLSVLTRSGRLSHNCAHKSWHACGQTADLDALGGLCYEQLRLSSRTGPACTLASHHESAHACRTLHCDSWFRQQEMITVKTAGLAEIVRVMHDTGLHTDLKQVL